MSTPNAALRSSSSAPPAPERREPLRRRGLSIRMRLTLSYAGFLVVAGVVLGAVLLVVLRYVPDGVELATITRRGEVEGIAPNRSALVEQALPLLGAGIAVLAVLGLVGGWVLAGRVLRPLEVLTQAVREAGQGSLSHRIDLDGPHDELREVADLFDDMLARLQRAFEEQRRFTANASHELRTPIATMRTMIEVARADPERRGEEFLARLGEVNDRSAATLEAMLQLARAEQAGLRRAPCDLVEVLEDALEHLEGDVEARLDLPQEPVLVAGDHPLLDQLARNFVVNAVVHNVADRGVVWLGVRRDSSGGAVLSVANTGPQVEPAVAANLTEPFVRGAGRTRAARADGGSGLGLAIVASVASAHDARLHVAPRAGGGLEVTVHFARLLRPDGPPGAR